MRAFHTLASSRPSAPAMPKTVPTPLTIAPWVVAYQDAANREEEHDTATTETPEVYSVTSPSVTASASSQQRTMAEEPSEFAGVFDAPNTNEVSPHDSLAVAEDIPQVTAEVETMTDGPPFPQNQLPLTVVNGDGHANLRRSRSRSRTPRAVAANEIDERHRYLQMLYRHTRQRLEDFGQELRRFRQEARFANTEQPASAEEWRLDDHDDGTGSVDSVD